MNSHKHTNTNEVHCISPSFIYGVAHFSSEYTSLPALKNLSFLSSVQSSKLLSGRRCREGGKREIMISCSRELRSYANSYKKAHIIYFYVKAIAKALCPHPRLILAFFIRLKPCLIQNCMLLAEELHLQSFSDD